MKNRFNKNKYTLLRGNAREVTSNYEEEIRIVQELDKKRTPNIVKHKNPIEI